MEMEELEIVIRKDGTTSIMVKGVTGTRCLAVTKGMEEALGTTTGREFTAAYYERDLSSEEKICSSDRKRV